MCHRYGVGAEPEWQRTNPGQLRAGAKTVKRPGAADVTVLAGDGLQDIQRRTDEKQLAGCRQSAAPLDLTGGEVDEGELAGGRGR